MTSNRGNLVPVPELTMISGPPPPYHPPQLQLMVRAGHNCEAEGRGGQPRSIQKLRVPGSKYDQQACPASPAILLVPVNDCFLQNPAPEGGVSPVIQIWTRLSRPSLFWRHSSDDGTPSVFKIRKATFQCCNEGLHPKPELRHEYVQATSRATRTTAIQAPSNNKKQKSHFREKDFSRHKQSMGNCITATQGNDSPVPKGNEDLPAETTSVADEENNRESTRHSEA
jgi:hypothetical protein